VRPISADTVAQGIEIERLRARLFVSEQTVDRLMHENRCYQDELAQLLTERKAMREAGQYGPCEAQGV